MFIFILKEITFLIINNLTFYFQILHQNPLLEAWPVSEAIGSSLTLESPSPITVSSLGSSGTLGVPTTRSLLTSYDSLIRPPYTSSQSGIHTPWTETVDSPLSSGLGVVENSLTSPVTLNPLLVKPQVGLGVPLVLSKAYLSNCLKREHILAQLQQIPTLTNILKQTTIDPLQWNTVLNY